MWIFGYSLGLYFGPEFLTKGFSTFPFILYCIICGGLSLLILLICYFASMVKKTRYGSEKAMSIGD